LDLNEKRTKSSLGARQKRWFVNVQKGSFLERSMLVKQMSASSPLYQMLCSSVLHEQKIQPVAIGP
jgi:hypothetical protein